MSEMVFFTKKMVSEIEYSEIDIDFNFELFGDDADNWPEYRVLESNGISYESDSINIDRMLGALNEMKSNGATHVSIDYHIDHHAYEMYGFKIGKSSEAEILEYKNKCNINTNIERKMEKLCEEFNKLKKQLK